jgi:hypothetical protein
VTIAAWKPSVTATTTVATDPMTDIVPLRPQKNAGAGSGPCPARLNPRGNGIPMATPIGATTAIAIATRAASESGRSAGMTAGRRAA